MNESLRMQAYEVASRGDFIRFMEILHMTMAHDGGAWHALTLHSVLSRISVLLGEDAEFQSTTGVRRSDPLSWRSIALLLVAALE
jgi:hypothetical protein